MGIHTRVGLAAGTIGFALLYLAQPLSGAAAVLLALVVGLLAGLGTAKWLPRDWYGHQFKAGARAGTLACAVALAGFLASLLVAGPYTTEALAVRSHLMGIDLGATVRSLRVVGWLGAGVALSLVGLIAGTGVAALASQLGAWDKNRHAIEVVKRARAAAQRTGRLATTAPRTRPALPSLSDHVTPQLGGQPPTTGNTPTSSLPSWPSLPATPPPDRDLSGSDLAGLNESWHSLRSPLNVFPAPEASEQPWTRHDERLPPGALLPDELLPDELLPDELLPDELALDPTGGVAADDAASAPASDTTTGTGQPVWDGTAWREDSGWMDYEDGGAPAEPAQEGVPSLEDGAEDEADDGEEADNWLN